MFGCFFPVRHWEGEISEVGLSIPAHYSRILRVDRMASTSNDCIKQALGWAEVPLASGKGLPLQNMRIIH